MSYSTIARSKLFSSGKVGAVDITDSVATSGDLLVIDSSESGIEFTSTPTVNSITIEDSTGEGGTLSWNSINGTLDVSFGDVTLQLGQEQHFYAKATEAIANGDVVMFAGAQGDHLLISKADLGGSTFAPEYIIGVATQAFATNDFGYVTSFGLVRGLNTSGYNEGDILYADPDNVGKLTTTVPSSPDHVLQMAAVTRSHITQGTIFVRPTHKLDTDEVEEGSSNLYYTDARVQTVIDTNTAGFITDYTVTQGDVTAHQAALSITESQISDLQTYLTSVSLDDVSDVDTSSAATGDVLTKQSDGSYAFGSISSTASQADSIYVTESPDTNSYYEIPYIDPAGTANSYKDLYSDATAITFNPYSNILNTARFNATSSMQTPQLIVTGAAPSSSSATGTAGEIRTDSNYIYVCTATNTWKRVALSTW
jgi:hypothetical protein